MLVTGGAGFIGSALIWGLNRQGCTDIVVVDRLRHTDKWRHLVPLRFRDYVEAEDFLARLQDGELGTFDIVLHLGACSSTTERDATYLVRNNFEFTKALARTSLATNARFLYASSAATYGNGAAGMSDTEPDLDGFSPLNAYGFSKHLFDRHAWRNGWLDHIVGLKYFNVFGPNEDHKGDMRSMVHKATVQLQETGTIRLFKSYRPDYKDGEQQRDFLYVKDAVAMTLHLATRTGANGLFNIGSGTTHTWNELAAAVCRALKRETAIEYIDMPEDLRPRYQYFTKADIGKLRGSGFSDALTPFESAIHDYATNYLLRDRYLGSPVSSASGLEIDRGTP
ncbi:ADP-L-glycero-D-manno-heptose-6-epimerase [Nitrospira sp. KM1]|nr:ADP-L-glycero-D-manno-heptose-6-epimerase [Nitrospira sp. KM1]